MRSIALAVVLLAISIPARAQTPLYSSSMDDASGGWTISFSPPWGEPTWAFDATPASTPFGPYHSPPACLNYNNGVDYTFMDASHLDQTAASPDIQLLAATGIPVLTFWCNNRSQEGTCNQYEKAKVRITKPLPGILYEECINWFEPGSTCASAVGFPGWHRHSLVLDRTWGKVNVEFFVMLDWVYNDTQGWFIDDVDVIDWPAPVTYCTAKVNSLGCVPQIDSVGVPSLESGASFDVTATQVLNNKLGIFFYSVGGRGAFPFMGGTLCVAGTPRRTPGQVSGGNPPPNDCSGTFSFDFLAWQASGRDPNLVEGTQVNAQYFYRDSGASFGVGLTDAIEFTLIP